MSVARGDVVLVTFPQAPGQRPKRRPAVVVHEMFQQQQVARQGSGGVIYFPAGEYQFEDHIHLLDGVILRGATPRGATSAHSERYNPPTCGACASILFQEVCMTDAGNVVYDLVEM